jgi:1,4-alpha-glucan branching enzyme
MQATEVKVTGMGAIVTERGTAFRVWAPHAERVSVTGSFNQWNSDSDLLEPEGDGYWYGFVDAAGEGDEYRFHLKNGEFESFRIDPYAREVTSSVGNGVIRRAQFEWKSEEFHMPPINELVIYELHIGTFGAGKENEVRGFAEARMKIPYLQKLGVNAVKVMPVAEFAGDRSWGYNPAHPFAVEQAYGGPNAFREFVDTCHLAGIGVILDVVYNHFGPSDLDLWRFDGWHEGEGGGIYFYNDWRADTPWGATRPDYGRAEVRQYIRDNAMMWMEEYRVDGLRLDATVYVRTVRGPSDPGCDLPEGWSLMQALTKEVHERFPGRVMIAEDLQDNEWLTKPVEDGGAGFDAQWAAHFVHPVREAAILPADEARSMHALAEAIGKTFNGNGHERVIYSESHDEVANGKARVPQEIDAGDPQNWFAKKRSTLAAALVFLSPGVPMIFQGQEFLTGGWFQDTDPVDWGLRCENDGIVRLFRELIGLRRNASGVSRGLLGGGLRFVELNDAANVVAFQRWHAGGPGDDVIAVVNFRHDAIEGLWIPVPADGEWKMRFHSDWQGYGDGFGTTELTNAMAEGGGMRVSVPGYSVAVFSQDAA